MSRVRPRQLDLFQKQVPCPSWEDLPSPLQDDVLLLVTQLLVDFARARVTSSESERSGHNDGQSRSGPMAWEGRRPPLAATATILWRSTPERPGPLRCEYSPSIARGPSTGDRTFAEPELDLSCNYDAARRSRRQAPWRRSRPVVPCARTRQKSPECGEKQHGKSTDLFTH